MNHTEYVTYEQALKLKQLGFDWPCRFYYTKEDAPEDCVWQTSMDGEKDYNAPESDGCSWLKPICSASTQSVALRWLREAVGIAINVDAHDGGGYTWDMIYLPDCKDDIAAIQSGIINGMFPTYEAALSNALDFVLDLITNVSNGEI